MNYQLISYIIFLSSSFFITIKIGWVLYKNGEVYLLEIFQHQTAYVHSINKLLLIGYYLVNLGKAALEITNWEVIYTLPDVFRITGQKLGNLLLLLAIMHYINVIGLNIYSKTKKSLTIKK
ncbi:MAG: hypothetical protein N4A35_08895 [Flavobacteriales bacterium]|jgi:hypothetical protein|nr:hypothetical protein [Flavobacteriales bacterium]